MFRFSLLSETKGNAWRWYFQTSHQQVWLVCYTPQNRQSSRLVCVQGFNKSPNTRGEKFLVFVFLLSLEFPPHFLRLVFAVARATISWHAPKNRFKINSTSYKSNSFCTEMYNIQSEIKCLLNAPKNIVSRYVRIETSSELTKKLEI